MHITSFSLHEVPNMPGQRR